MRLALECIDSLVFAQHRPDSGDLSMPSCREWLALWAGGERRPHVPSPVRDEKRDWLLQSTVVVLLDVLVAHEKRHVRHSCC